MDLRGGGISGQPPYARHLESSPELVPFASTSLPRSLEG